MKKLKIISSIILLITIIIISNNIAPQVQAAGDSDIFDVNEDHFGVIERYWGDSEEDGYYVEILASSQNNVATYVYKFYKNEFAFGTETPFENQILKWNIEKKKWYVMLQVDENYVPGQDYEQGYRRGLEDGKGIGYDDGYEIGKQDGYNQGYGEGYEIGNTNGFNEGKEEGFYIGKDEGRKQVLDSLESQEILYHDVVLPNGISDQITNTSLIDNVGKVVLDGINYIDYGIQKIWTNHIVFIIRDYNNVTTYQSTAKDIMINNIDLPIEVFSTLNNYDVPGISNHNSLSRIMVSIPKTWLNGYSDEWTDTQKIDAFLSWLQANNVEIYYQLAEPITYDLVPLLTNADGSYAVGYKEGYQIGIDEGYGERNWFTNIIPTSFVMVWNTAIAPALNFKIMGITLYEVLLSFITLGIFIFFFKKLK